MSVTPLKWFDNQELELHKDSSERTLNTPEAIGILTKHIPALGATDLTSSTLALVGKCFLVVGLKPDAPLEGRDWIDMCYEAKAVNPKTHKNPGRYHLGFKFNPAIKPL